MASKTTSPKRNGPIAVVQRWMVASSAWFKIKKLERDFRDSEKFQQECEKLRCFNLAKIEEGFRAQLADQINRLRK